MATYNMTATAQYRVKVLVAKELNLHSKNIELWDSHTSADMQTVMTNEIGYEWHEVRGAVIFKNGKQIIETMFTVNVLFMPKGKINIYSLLLKHPEMKMGGIRYDKEQMSVWK